MNLLFDQNISYRILNCLPETFSNSRHVRTAGLENQTDSIIWQYARDNNYMIVTFDADFYDISLIYGFPPKIIWLRTGNLTTAKIAELLINHYQDISTFSDNTELSCMEIH
jgi:predicted nuclease of predicted toxin-antitoxin system